VVWSPAGPVPAVGVGPVMMAQLPWGSVVMPAHAGREPEPASKSHSANGAAAGIKPD
jgi:hypothetical protein